jgi:hypothetical protein
MTDRFMRRPYNSPPASTVYRARSVSLKARTDSGPRMPIRTENGSVPLRYIPLSYTHADSQTSALRLVLTLNPEWEGHGNNIGFVRFTDGITNTVS